jgi:hypothetical protein
LVKKSEIYTHSAGIFVFKILKARGVFDPFRGIDQIARLSLHGFSVLVGVGCTAAVQKNKNVVLLWLVYAGKSFSLAPILS